MKVEIMEEEKKQNSNAAKPVLALHPTTLRILKEFQSIEESSRFLKVTIGAASKAVNAFRICKGYRLTFKDKYIDPQGIIKKFGYRHPNQ
jgi:hypothetical protein